MGYLVQGPATTINATSVNTAAIVANATGIYPSSNTIALGNSTGQFALIANSVTAVNVSAAVVNTTGFSGNATSLNPTANTIAFGNSIGQWQINANTITAVNVTAATYGIHTGNVVTAANVSTTNLLFTTANGTTVAANTTGIHTGNVVSAANVSTTNCLFTTANGTTVNVATLYVTTNTIGFGSSSIAAASGYSYLPNGLILNYGNVVSNSIGQNAITFPLAYQTNAYAINITPVAALAATIAITHANGITKTGFTLYTTNSTANTNTGINSCYYFAIGS